MQPTALLALQFSFVGHESAPVLHWSHVSLLTMKTLTQEHASSWTDVDRHTLASLLPSPPSSSYTRRRPPGARTVVAEEPDRYVAALLQRQTSARGGEEQERSGYRQNFSFNMGSFGGFSGFGQ